MRRIVYLTGTRADFGLMESTLKEIHASPKLSLSIAVTGMHLSTRYGETIVDVKRSGLPICATLELPSLKETGGGMALAISHEIAGLVSVLENEKPDMILLLGDRGEMLAGAIVAIHLSIPIVHIHGGELSGTVDESVRHAISKFAHYHFTATTASRERLIRMGEVAENIFVTGAPGLDSLLDVETPSREFFCEKFKLDFSQPLALVIFHPVVQRGYDNQGDAENIMEALVDNLKFNALVLLPNADSGGAAIRHVMEMYENKGCRVINHLSRKEFLAAMRIADILIGNSSTGIIEAASLGIPVVNVGDRQNRRERNANVVDVSVSTESIQEGIIAAMTLRGPFLNVYGDGFAAKRIVSLLETLPIDKTLLAKCNVY